MSDNKDDKTDKIKITPSMDLSDLDSTIRLDLGGNQNVVSTSPSDEITSDDFDKTIDGLQDIEEMMASENDPATEEETLSLSDDIDFGELDAGINALSKDLLEPASEEDGVEADENSFDTLDEPFNDEAESMFDITQPNAPDFSNNEDEPLLSTSESLSTEIDALLDIPEEIELGENEASKEIEAIEEIEELSPVIELTEEMLDESAQPQLPELNDSQESDNENDEDNHLESIVEVPGLTTTETNVLADATAAIKEITEEEKAVMPQEFTTPAQLQPPVEQSDSSNSLPVFMAILGIAAGGFGAWMAYDASNQVADLKRQIQNMSPAPSSKQTQSVADIQQRLTKIERRLTGTPTIEAAAPLGSASSKPEKRAPETKAVVKVITPQTKVTEADAKAGDWVVNLSSHAKESLANREQARLQKVGLNAEVHTAQVKDRTWYRVQITGFANKDAAKTQLRDIQQQSGIKGAWIGKR